MAEGDFRKNTHRSGHPGKHGLHLLGRLRNRLVALVPWVGAQVPRRPCLPGASPCGEQVDFHPAVWWEQTWEGLFCAHPYICSRKQSGGRARALRFGEVLPESAQFACGNREGHFVSEVPFSEQWSPCLQNEEPDTYHPHWPHRLDAIRISWLLIAGEEPEEGRHPKLQLCTPQGAAGLLPADHSGKGSNEGERDACTMKLE